MTESEWMTGSNPIPMLEFVRGLVSDRKLRLYCCRCCRGLGDLLDDRCLRAVETAEAFVENRSTKKELDLAHAAVLASRLDPRSVAAASSPDCFEISAVASDAAYIASDVFLAETYFQSGSGHGGVDAAIKVSQIVARAGEAYRLALRATSAAKAGLEGEDRTDHARPEAEPNSRWRDDLSDLVRCIFGNPYRPVAFAPAWRTRRVVRLAEVAYKRRSMPEGNLGPRYLSALAHALEGIGCSDPAILGHLRSLHPHARGCWVIDLLLRHE